MFSVHRPILLAGAALAMAVSVTGCRNAEQSQVSEQPDGLAANDPAVRTAVGSEIMVDPNMVGQSNSNAATGGARPVTGGVPVVRGGGTAAEAVADARTRVGGELMRAPNPGTYEETCQQSDCRQAQPRPATLGGLARQQAGGPCAADIQYGNEWAQRLPAAFPIYPRAALVEAAGINNGRCNLRVVNFQSRAGMQAVLDFYYTMARRNGFTAEHLLRGNEHYLGGTKGNEAFVIMARNMPGGVVDVDMVSNGGR